MNRPIGADEAATKLAELLAALDASVKHDAVRMKRTESNRINMLVVHAVTALVVPPLFALNGPYMTGPTWEWLVRIPAFPFSFAGLLWLGGAILLPAALARRGRWEMAGLWLISIWYLTLSVGFGLPVVAYSHHLLAGHRLPPMPTFYAWVVYAHLAIIMQVHLHTLRRMIRARRSQ